MSTHFCFSVLLNNMNRCPEDLAKLEFYQFVKSPLGANLHAMLLMPGQPSPDLWDQHNRWWLNAREALDNKTGKRGDSPDWPTLVIWKSRIFMSIVDEVLKVIMINPTMWPLEQYIWSFVSMRNILLDLFLVEQSQLKKPVTYFDKVAVIGKFP